MAAQANQGTETKKRFSLFSYIRETKQELKRVSWPTKKELLKKYRSLKNLKEASVEELETILPEKVAIELHNYLKERNDL